MKMRLALLASALFNYISSLLVKGMKTVSLDAEQEAVRNAKLARVNGHRRGRGKRSFVKVHERIEAKDLAHAKRRRQGRWAPPGLPLHETAGYHTPKDAMRAVRRVQRSHDNGHEAPARMIANAEAAWTQLGADVPVRGRRS